MHVDQQIQLNTALDIDILGFTVPHYLGLKYSLLDPGKRADRPSESAVAPDVQAGCPVEDVGKIEVYDVVADDEVRIIAEY